MVTDRSPSRHPAGRQSNDVPLKRTLLVVEDEKDIRDLLRFHLEQEGWTVREAETGEEALKRAEAERPALILLDIMLPGADGLEVCRRLRAGAGATQVPIIMLTAKAAEVDRVLGLEIGADDYITKPFSVREFRSRVKAALRRTRMSGDETAEGPITAAELTVDPGRRQVTFAGERVQLTYVEFELLAALARSPGHVFERRALLERIWGDSTYRDPRTIDVHIRHLREKIEPEPKQPEYLLTVRGVGYRFRDEELG
jgi:DNA-binding response OmpR family regulator